MDVTEHPTENGKAYLAVVLDAFSRRVVGWSITDHMRSELVVDALQMAIWRRRPHLVRPSPIPTTCRPTPRGPSVDACAAPACSAPWDRSVTASIIRRRELLRHAPARAARRTSLGEPPATRPGHLRVDRGLVQPASTPQLLPDAQSRGLRSRSRGMISNQQQLSAGAGEAHSCRVVGLGPHERLLIVVAVTCFALILQAVAPRCPGPVSIQSRWGPE